MNKCVPSWNLEEPPPPHLLPSSSGLHAPTSESDCELTELTWMNGNIAEHGLSYPRITKPVPTARTATPSWDEPCPSETLEAVVDQATRALLLPFSASSSSAAAAANQELTICFGGVPHHQPPSTADALVPCNEEASVVRTCVESCGGDGDGRRKRARVGEGSFSQGRRRMGERSIRVTGSCEMANVDETGGFTSPTYTARDGNGSPETENASFHDSVCHSMRSQTDGFGGVEKTSKEETVTPSISSKKSRAAAIHNQSEQKRRDRINQKMRTLQKLVPNCSKVDKASMLDEVIDYMKQLQVQVQMMSMMMPMGMQQCQMAMMAQQIHSQMGLRMMGMSPLGRHGIASVLPTTPFVPLVAPTWDPISSERMQQAATSLKGGPNQPDGFPACLPTPQMQPMSMDAYNQMAALYQKLYQLNPPVIPKT